MQATVIYKITLVHPNSLTISNEILNLQLWKFGVVIFQMKGKIKFEKTGPCFFKCQLMGGGTNCKGTQFLTVFPLEPSSTV